MRISLPTTQTFTYHHEHRQALTMWPVLLPTNKGWNTHVTQSPERSKTVWLFLSFLKYHLCETQRHPMNPTQPSLFRSRRLHTPGVKQTLDEPYCNNQPDVYTSVTTLGRWVIEQIELSIMDRTVSRNHIQPSRSLDNNVQHCVISCVATYVD